MPDTTPLTLPLLEATFKSDYGTALINQGETGPGRIFQKSVEAWPICLSSGDESFVSALQRTEVALEALKA